MDLYREYLAVGLDTFKAFDRVWHKLILILIPLNICPDTCDMNLKSEWPMFLFLCDLILSYYVEDIESFWNWPLIIKEVENQLRNLKMEQVVLVQQT